MKRQVTDIEKIFTIIYRSHDLSKYPKYTNKENEKFINQQQKTEPNKRMSKRLKQSLYNFTKEKWPMNILKEAQSH